LSEAGLAGIVVIQKNICAGYEASLLSTGDQSRRRCRYAGPTKAPPCSNDRGTYAGLLYLIPIDICAIVRCGVNLNVIAGTARDIYPHNAWLPPRIIVIPISGTYL